MVLVQVTIDSDRPKAEVGEILSACGFDLGLPIVEEDAIVGDMIRYTQERVRKM